jgi:hypothetical protein
MAGTAAAAGLLEAVAVGGSSVEKTFRLRVALSRSMSDGFDDGAAYRNSGDGKARVGLPRNYIWWLVVTKVIDAVKRF